MNTVHRQTGFSMIEVLISLLVLSIGLLGLAFLQGQGMKYNTDAYLRTQATILAYDIVDRMRANSSASGSGGYSVSSKSAVDATKTAYDSCKSSTCYCDKSDGSVICTTSNLAVYDLGKWYEAQESLMPVDPLNPSTISKSVNTHTITIKWIERDSLRQQVWVVEL